jgi:predicted nucleotidyltransferase
MKLDEATIERIRVKLAEVCPELPVRLVVLFGSQADGRARPDSDVDIAVQLLPKGTWSDAFRVGGCIEYLVEMEVDVVVTDDAGATLLFNVATDGIPLYEARAGDWWRFRLAAWRTYEEAEPARRMQRTLLQKKLGVTV